MSTRVLYLVFYLASAVMTLNQDQGPGLPLEGLGLDQGQELDLRFPDIVGRDQALTVLRLSVFCTGRGQVPVPSALLCLVLYKGQELALELPLSGILGPDRERQHLQFGCQHKSLTLKQ